MEKEKMTTQFTSQYRIRVLIAMLALVLGVLGAPVAHANVYLSSRGDVHHKDVFAVDVFIDTEGRTLNAVEGSVILNDAATRGFIVKDISVAGSALSVWPRKPSLSSDGESVSFIGGTPSGLNDSKALLFTLFLQAGVAGPFSLQYSGITGYLNDGLGTKVSYKDHSATVQVLPALASPLDALSSVVSSDNQPPATFGIELLQDASQNAGMKYLSFETTDDRSGIAYYEVIEGSRAPVRSGTSYVLQNQTGHETIVVRAVDKAGNVRTEIYSRNGGFPWVLVTAIGVVAVLVIIFRRKIAALFA